MKFQWIYNFKWRIHQWPLLLFNFTTQLHEKSNPKFLESQYLSISKLCSWNTNQNKNPKLDSEQIPKLEVCKLRRLGQFEKYGKFRVGGNGENEKSEKGTPTSVWSRKRKKEHACYGTSCNRRVRLLRSSWWPLQSRISVGSAVLPLSISWTAPHRITVPPLFLILYK